MIEAYCIVLQGIDGAEEVALRLFGYVCCVRMNSYHSLQVQ